LNLQWELDVVQHSAPGQQAKGLKHEARVRAGRRRSIALQEHLAAIGFEQTVHEAKQRRLATARWADEAHELAGHDLQRDVVQSWDRRVDFAAQAVERFRDVPHVDLNQSPGATIVGRVAYLIGRPGSSTLG
jgi:predicted TIM-barrel fold metal-dependent hydrolase